MTSILASSLAEGESNTKPPYFDGNEYNVWKNKMKEFLRSKDPLESNVVEKGIIPKATSISEEERKL